MERIPSDESVSWDLCGAPERMANMLVPNVVTIDERADARGTFEEMLNMDFFKEEDNSPMSPFGSEEMSEMATAEETMNGSTPLSPHQIRKKQKVNSQPCTYPRVSKKKAMNFNTLRDSSNGLQPQQTKNPRRTFWNSKSGRMNDQNAAAPPTSTQLPTEIVVTFPLLNIKATTSLMTKPMEESSPPQPFIKQETEAEAVTTPPSYFFDPRSQPFYYPSSFQSCSSAGPLKDGSESANRFMLLEQPSSRQRKSYKNENRYIVPNPLTVCAKNSNISDLPQILRGVVTVKLVDKEGLPLPSEKGGILESVDGSLSQALYGPNLSTDFSLKVLQTSQGNMFRLLFVVSYVVDGVGNCEEKIYSRPFVVHSNRRKNSKEKPIVYEMKPMDGFSTGGTEVWIKGIGFNDKVAVTFGSQMAKIIEGSDNLLVVAAPPLEVDEDRTVRVTVANVYQGNEMKVADRNLFFNYRSTVKVEKMEEDIAQPMGGHSGNWAQSLQQHFLVKEESSFMM